LSPRIYLYIVFRFRFVNGITQEVVLIKELSQKV